MNWMRRRRGEQQLAISIEPMHPWLWVNSCESHKTQRKFFACHLRYCMGMHTIHELRPPRRSTSFSEFIWMEWCERNPWNERRWKKRTLSARRHDVGWRSTESTRIPSNPFLMIQIEFPMDASGHCSLYASGCIVRICLLTVRTWICSAPEIELAGTEIACPTARAHIPRTLLDTDAVNLISTAYHPTTTQSNTAQESPSGSCNSSILLRVLQEANTAKNGLAARHSAQFWLLFVLLFVIWKSRCFKKLSSNYAK